MVIPDPSVDDFEVAFKQFLTSYNKLPLEQRPSKLRKVASGISPEDNIHLIEFISIASTNDTHQASDSSFFSQTQMDVCSPCSENCYHKEELDEVNSLYAELLSSPELSPCLP